MPAFSDRCHLEHNALKSSTVEVTPQHAAAVLDRIGPERITGYLAGNPANPVAGEIDGEVWPAPVHEASLPGGYRAALLKSAQEL